MSHIAPKRCPYTYSVWRVSCDIDIINSTRTATTRNTYNEHCMIKRCTGDTTRSRCIPRKYISCNNICKTMGRVISLRSLFCTVIRRNQFKKTINIIPSPIMLIVKIISFGSHSSFHSKITKKKKRYFFLIPKYQKNGYMSIGLYKSFHSGSTGGRKNRFRSTFPSMPDIWPLSVYCRQSK